MTSIFKYCFFCSEWIPEKEINSSHLIYNTFVFNNIFELPHLQCQQHIGSSYCSKCLYEIKKVLAVQEEIERLEKLMERRKYQIKFLLKKHTDEFYKNITAEKKILLKPVQDLRSGIVSELLKSGRLEDYSSTTISTFENKYKRQKYVDGTRCSSKVPVPVPAVENTSISKIMNNESKIQTNHNSCGSTNLIQSTSIPTFPFISGTGFLEISVPGIGSQTTFDEISDPLDLLTDKNSQSIPLVVFPSPEFAVDEKIFSDIHDTTKNEYSQMINEQSFPERLSELQTNQFEEIRKTFLCGVCGETFERYDLLEEHDKLHPPIKNKSSPPPRKMCDQCGNFLSDAQALAKHTIRTHSNQSILMPSLIAKECKECGNFFSDSHSLKKHMMHLHHHEPNTRSSCTICERKFITKSELSVHILSHSNERNYRCLLCSKTFKTRPTLTTHLKIHTSEKPFSCRFCSNRFHEKASMIKHERIHTGVKPYSCKFCELRFNLKSEVRKHELIHLIEGNRTDQCSSARK